MNFFFLCFLFVGILDLRHGNAAASSALAVTKTLECTCLPEKPDPFESPVRYMQGSLTGKCIDSCRFRNLVRIHQVNDSTWTVANILHRGTYWKTEVPLNEVSEVRLLFEDFFPQVAHVAIRFRFKKPLRLIPLVEKSGSGLHQDNEISDLVFSPEAAVPLGEKQKLWPSLQSAYVFAFRFLSLEEAHEWMVNTQKHQVTQHSLDLDASERRQALMRAIEFSITNQFNIPYALLKKNCAAVAMDVLSAEGTPSPPFWKGEQRNLPLSFNFGTLRFLRQNKMLASSPSSASKISSLKDEFAGTLTQPIFIVK